MLLQNKEVIAVFGYGSQGRAQALNLRDSGENVLLGLRKGGQSWILALSDGWEPLSVEDAVEKADTLVFLLPDMAHAEVYSEQVLPRLRDGQMLLFAHGFSIHYGLVAPPAFVDVALVAPKSPGALVRREYQEGNGVPCLVAVHQNTTGKALDRAMNYAKAIGGGRAGLVQTSFAEETETDLFGEQAVLCGGVSELVVAGWETLVDAGYQPEVAYFECLHELKLIVDLLHEGGFKQMHEFISDTASYGDLSRGSRIVDQHVRQNMKTVLEEIQNGQFAKEWLAQQDDPTRWKREELQQDLDHPLEKVGRDLRSKMSWLGSRRRSAS
jgi:ketol-acid reductoisomerase